MKYNIIKFIWQPPEALSCGKQNRRVICRPPEELSDCRQKRRVIWRFKEEKSYLAAPRREELPGSHQKSHKGQSTRGPGALFRAQEYHCNLALFFFTWKVHKLMWIKHFAPFKYLKENKWKWLSPIHDTKTCQKLNVSMEPKITPFFPNAFRSLLCIQFVDVAFQLLRRSPLEKGPSLTYYGPALEPPLGGFGPKVRLCSLVFFNCGQKW